MQLDYTSLIVGLTSVSRYGILYTESEEYKMIDKETLLALIKGLTTKDGGSQYDSGTPCIKGKNYEILINFIKNS